MKKSNTYLAEGEIDLRNIIKKLWKEKILILSISIICSLLGYFYALSKPQEFVTEITLKNPSPQIFEPYIFFYNNDINNNNNNRNNIAGQYDSYFKLNFLSLDNLKSFVEESREFDNLKRYLKSRNISTENYFLKKIGEANENNKIMPNKYFINHTKELDGAIFLDKYAEFIKKKTIVELKNNLRISLQNTINIYQEALETAKKIQLENPIIKTSNQQQVVTEPEALFYKGTKVLSQNLNYLNKTLIKLENEEFDHKIASQKSITFSNNPLSLHLYFALGLMMGLFLSLVIIFFKNILK